MGYTKIEKEFYEKKIDRWRIEHFCSNLIILRLTKSSNPIRSNNDICKIISRRVNISLLKIQLNL